MTNIQLEFNINNISESEMKLLIMQKQLDEMNESMGKVRRKLFSEMGEVKKVCHNLQIQNEELRLKLKELKNEKTEWIYKTGDNLFDVRECQTACG